MSNSTTINNDRMLAELIHLFSKNPIYFIEHGWGLTPQPVKDEFKSKVEDLLSRTWDEWEEAKTEFTAMMFEPFQKDKHITWQQWLFFISVEKAIRKEASNKISVVSGHGTGKSMSGSILILWFLAVHKDAQVPCTAPTSDQMYDVLWKELNKWISRMRDESPFKRLYIWESNHIRMKPAPNVWFARAKTSSKENSEALAGVHADDVLLVVDEASAVPEEVFNTAEGAFTNENVLAVLFSNGTRDIGYFYDTHHKMKSIWQNLSLNSEESPIVDSKYVANMEERHGRDSTEFRIRVLGGFPGEGVVDMSGYVRLYEERDTRYMAMPEQLIFSGTPIMGVDPAGEGKNKSVIYIRDFFMSVCVFEEARTNAKELAQTIITLATKYKIAPRDIVVDEFGIGAKVVKELALSGYDVYSVNTGEDCNMELDREKYINKRAEYYYKSAEWGMQGGKIVEHKAIKEQMPKIRYKRNLKGKIQIMPKVEMKKRLNMDSPDHTDAHSMTFARRVEVRPDPDAEHVHNQDFDKNAIF